MVGWQQRDDEPHLAKEQHGPITTQNTVQRMCPIVRSHFPLYGANDIHRNQTPPHAIKTTRTMRPVTVYCPRTSPNLQRRWQW
eukprot:gene14312-biopygen23112